MKDLIKEIRELKRMLNEKWFSKKEMQKQVNIILNQAVILNNKLEKISKDMKEKPLLLI